MLRGNWNGGSKWASQMPDSLDAEYTRQVIEDFLEG